MNATEEEAVNPLELLQVLSDATSQDPTKLTHSTARLKELLELFGTFDALQEIAARKELALPVRQQAIIQLKNASNNRWRSRKSEFNAYLPLPLPETINQTSF